jgi:hypothetical protein
MRYSPSKRSTPSQGRRRAGRVQMHVVAHGLEVAAAAAIHHQRLVAPAEQTAKDFVPPVEPRRVRPQEPLHPRHQVGLRPLHSKVEVIGHQAEGMDLPAGLATRLVQGGEETLAILVAAEDVFTPVAPVHQVIDGAGVLHSELAGHGRDSGAAAAPVNGIVPSPHAASCSVRPLAERAAGGADHKNLPVFQPNAALTLVGQAGSQLQHVQFGHP